MIDGRLTFEEASKRARNMAVVLSGCCQEMNAPTQRQLDLIADIQEVVGIEFTGTTKQEASVYIDEYLDDFELMKEVEHD